MLIGSKTPLGSAKALLFELGCEYVKVFGEVELGLVMKQMGWELLPVGAKGGPIASGEESAAYPKIASILKTAAENKQQVSEVLMAGFLGTTVLGADFT